MITRLRSLRRDEQAGFTLVELLVTISIMAIAFVVILGAISVFFSSTRVHRNSADLDAAMRTYVERLSDKAVVPYADCTSTYAVAADDLPDVVDRNGNSHPFLSLFEPAVSVQYWNGTPAPAAYGATCTSPDKGEQQLTLTLTRREPDGQQDSLVIVKRDEVQP